MPERRTDPLTGDEVLLAPGRGSRPHDTGENGGDDDAPCPFCPGNERQTPPAVAVFEDGAGWSVRAFRNKFPAVEPPEGVHEVIVDSPAHAPEFTADSLRMYRDRFAYHAAGAEVDAASISLFKNAGLLAGASRKHPHAQLIALRELPERPARARRIAQEYYSGHGACVLCDRIAALDDACIVHETGAFVCYVPEIARFADEYWIAPRAHAPSFGETADAQISELYAVLARVTEGLAQIRPAPSYNLIIESGAFGLGPAAAFSHWYLSAIVRTSAVAGFELSSGMSINSGDPKESAARLRHMVTSHAP